VSSSRDANGNLVLTNAPPGPVAAGAAPQGYQARPGSLASFFGGAMRQKQAGAQDKAAQAAALKLPDMIKNAAEIEKIIAETKNIQNPKPKIEIPMANQPAIGADKNVVVVKDGVPTNVPVRQQVPISKGTDGKMYVMGADGKALREATADEVKSMKPR
jgi:hypothetical protein